MLQGEDSECEFILPNGHQARLVTNGADKISEGTNFVILSGGYHDSEGALKAGAIVKESLLCYAAKNRLGIDLGKDVASTFLADTVKHRIFEEHGVRMVDDVHGLSVYQEDYPTSCISVKGLALVNPRDMEYFTTELNRIVVISRKITEKVKLSMELLTFSYFEKSERSRFLTLVLAVEALLQPEERPKNVQLLVDSLKEQTNSCSISEADKKSIIGSLNWLYKDSISKSLKKMADNYLSDIEYGGMTASKFISKCYDARSQLVHTGEVSDNKHNIGFLAANLELYVTHMVTKLAGI
jgi:hypothetical protein